MTPPLSPTASHSAKSAKKTGKSILIELLKEDEEEVRAIKRGRRKSALNATRDKSRDRSSPAELSPTRRKT